MQNSIFPLVRYPRVARKTISWSFSCPRDPEKMSCLTFARERNKVSLTQTERNWLNRIQSRNALQLWSMFELDIWTTSLNGVPLVTFSGISIQDKMTKVLKQCSMIGLKQRKGYHNTQPRFQEKLKKESHQTSLFRVEFREKIALLSCLIANGHEDFAS